MPASGVSTSAALMIASKLELVGADIEALLVLYWGFEYSSAIVAICREKQLQRFFMRHLLPPSCYMFDIIAFYRQLK